LGLLLFLALVGLGFVFWNQLTQEPPLDQVNVVIDGDPVIIASWQPKPARVLVVTIPANFAVSAVRSLGKYPLRSLWKLGVMQGSSGSILAQSVGELLAIPTPWYIGESSQSSDANATSRIQQIFSLISLPQLLSGRIKTNMPTGTLLMGLWRISRINRDRFVEIPLGVSVVTNELQADGTLLSLVTPQLVETVLGDEFELNSIREESFTIAVNNTTAASGLAERAARIIDRLGGNVVSVGNENRQIERCQIRTDQQRRDSATAKIFAHVFDCENGDLGSDDYANVVIAVGTDYASRFAP
jgi:hypothetical protein